MSSTRQLAARAASVAAVLLAYRLVAEMDQGETAGGQLTGPMILACFASLPVLVASVIMQSRQRRIALFLWIGGMILAVPLASYDLFPGWWSRVGPWPNSGGYVPPLFVAEWESLILVLLLLSSLVLQAWPSSK